MSGLGRKRLSKWDSKEDTHHHHSTVNANSGSYYRDKESEPVRFNAETNGEARTRSRVSQNNDNSYFSEQDDTRQQFFPRLVFRVVTNRLRDSCLFVLLFLLNVSFFLF